EHFFRRQYGQLVATLARVAGFQHLELAEDAVQIAFANAIEAWATDGPPVDPGSWLYRVACNQLVVPSRRRRRCGTFFAGASPARAGASARASSPQACAPSSRRS